MPLRTRSWPLMRAGRQARHLPPGSQHWYLIACASCECVACRPRTTRVLDVSHRAVNNCCAVVRTSPPTSSSVRPVDLITEVEGAHAQDNSGGSSASAVCWTSWRASTSASCARRRGDDPRTRQPTRQLLRPRHRRRLPSPPSGGIQRQPNVPERGFARLKRWRDIDTRYATHARHYHQDPAELLLTPPLLSTGHI